MIKRFFGQGSERTQKTKKSIFLLFLFHMFNMVITLALVPLSIQLLGNVRYGVWVTVSSVIFWLNYLDFGIGNGLRNKVAESFALGDTPKAKTYVSTAYFIFLLAALCVIVITLLLNLFVNWQYVLNAPLDLSGELKLIMPLAFALFATQVFLKLINSIINADQRPALNGLISLLINGFSIGGLYILFISHNNSFLAFATVSFLMPVIILLVVSVILFKTSYTEIAPSYRCIDLSTSRALFSLGMQFFIIQAAGLVVFATQNLIISQVLGPAQVTVYNVALRYFSLVTLVFGVILTPFWSAYTEAYVKKDFIWIKKMVNKIILLWSVFTAGTILMVIISDRVYLHWVGASIQVPFLLTILIAVNVTIANWNNIFGYFINGVGKIRLQFYSAIFILIVNIPLSVILVKIPSLGIAGIVIANCLVLFISSIWAPLQYYKIINGTAKGIWNK